MPTAGRNVIGAAALACHSLAANIGTRSPSPERWHSSGSPSFVLETSAQLEAPAATKTPTNSTPGDDPAASSAELGRLLRALHSESETEREAAWAACYEGYRDVVWTRAFYVLRTVSWLREPREAAADVTSDVFVGLMDAAKNYREAGKPEKWLAQIAVRAALRAREKLTGEWSGRAGTSSARRSVSFEDQANAIASELDSIDRDELLELERRIGALRASPEQRDRRWAEFIDLYRDGHGFAEIGKRLDLTEATARNWLVAIRKHLAGPPPSTNV